MLLTHEFISAYVRTLPKSERGAALVEYALLVALIAVVCIAAVTLLGRKAKSNFTSVSNSI
jgi:pilus assembly protein Flp/PilA